jgi:hypothetical protein
MKFLAIIPAGLAISFWGMAVSLWHDVMYPIIPGATAATFGLAWIISLVAIGLTAATILVGIYFPWTHFPGEGRKD